MQLLKIGITDSTPEIYLDKISGNFTISGRSLPEEAMKFYNPVLEWIKRYIENPNETTVSKFELDYINSSSTRVFNDILVLLEKFYQKDFKVTISWKYNMEDIEFKEIGEDLTGIYKMPFKIEGYEEIRGINNKFYYYC